MKGSFTTRKGALYCIVMTCLCNLLATGCASKYGAQTTDVHYYPDCYQPIADLRSAEKSFNTTMVMGTTMGALLGAVIGRTAYRKKQSLLPRVNAANPVIRFFSFCGRHSLLIYMLHQPVLTIGTILIFG
mgnify:CR=1 FL=1